MLRAEGKPRQKKSYPYIRIQSGMYQGVEKRKLWPHRTLDRSRRGEEEERGGSQWSPPGGVREPGRRFGALPRRSQAPGGEVPAGVPPLGAPCRSLPNWAAKLWHVEPREGRGWVRINFSGVGGDSLRERYVMLSSERAMLWSWCVVDHDSWSAFQTGRGCERNAPGHGGGGWSPARARRPAAGGAPVRRRRARAPPPCGPGPPPREPWS